MPDRRSPSSRLLCGGGPAALTPTPRERGWSAMAHWLLKSEPDDWSWTEQVAKGRDGAEWTGIRNFSAQNHLRAMKKGEQAFFYHTGKERAIIGIVRIKANQRLSGMALVRLPRLSVQPVTEAEWRIVCQMAGLD